jgi:DNA-binding IclR family transcriptional regulator
MGQTPRSQTTINSLRVLSLIASNGGATFNELVEASDLSQSTVYQHLATLEDFGLIVKRDSVYYVGLRTLEFGGIARSRYQAYLTGRDEMRSLATTLGAVVQLAFLEDDRCITVYQEGQALSNLEETRVGTVLDLHSSASGKVLLATRSEDRRETFLEESMLDGHTSNTVTDPGQLHEELVEVAEENLAFDFEEQFSGVYCVATAVDFGERTGALSVSVDASDYDPETVRTTIADEVHKTGRVIEMDATYR